MKKLLLILIAIIVSVSVFGVTEKIGKLYYDLQGSAAAVVKSPTNTAYYRNLKLTSLTIPSKVTYNNKEYTVTEIRGQEIFEGCTTVVSVNIANTVQSLPSQYAFTNCSAMTTLQLSSSLTEIPYYAFGGCTKLSSVTIPNNVTKIGKDAFHGCSKLATVTLGNKIASIGSYAFGYCEKLESIELPSSLTSIGDYAFRNCTTLTNINIPNSVIQLGECAFCYCSSLVNISVPGSIRKIPTGAFSSCTNLSSVTLTEGLDSIGMQAFYNNDALTSVTIPNSATYIGQEAFEYSSNLTSVTIGSGMQKIDSWAFRDCPLTSIYISATTPPTVGVNVPSSAYSTCTIYVPAASVSAYKTASWWQNFNIQALPTYTITWKQDNGSTINTTTVTHGQTPTHANPTKSATAEYTYTFKAWTPTIVPATANATYTATYTATKRKYTITFNNYDNTQLQSSSVEYGKVPAYTNGTPTKPATAEYTYTFKGWTPEIVSVTGPATYTAVFDSVKNVYQVTWVNADGSELNKDSLEYGAMPTHDDLVKANTAEYTYTFAGWTPDTVAVTGDATYIAVFDSVKNVYQITWLNADGSELGKDSLEYGEMPEYKGEAPTKDSTTVYAYSFAGWTQNIATVTGDATYTAKFDSTKIEYNVDITIPDTIESHGSVTIDGEPTYGDTITITATPDDGYYFDGWSDGNTDNPREIEITGDTAVYPIFKECGERITYLTETIYKGQSFAFGGQELTTRGTYRDTIVLANGCDSIVVLKLNVLNSKVKFNLRVVVNDETMGTVSGTGAYVSGSEVTITATPASSKYIFVRWYNEDEGIDVYENPYTFTLTRNLQLRAVFRKAPRKTPKANNKNK